MTEHSPTKNQLSFIKKLRDAGYEGEETLQHYLHGKRKSRVSDLSVKEASELIEKLKSIHGTDNIGIVNKNATKKQIQFIMNLQDTHKNMETAKKYLAGLKKKRLEEITINEASGLIDMLKVIKGGKLGGNGK